MIIDFLDLGCVCVSGRIQVQQYCISRHKFFFRGTFYDLCAVKEVVVLPVVFYISTNSLTTAVVTMLDDGIFKFSTTMHEWC